CLHRCFLHALLVALIFLGTAALPQTPKAPAPELTATPGFNVDAATRDYLAQIPEDKKRASDAYFEGGYWLYLWGFLYGAAIMLFLVVSGISARLRDFAARLTMRRNLQTAIYFMGFLLLVALLQFPLTFYQDFVREHHYGLAT